MSLTPPPKVQKLQAALHAKAKGSPGYRFYLLYDKLYRADVLAFAYRCCAANGGAAGVDGQTFEVIEAYGEQRWLDELAEELKQRMYRPQPVRRVYIPKPDGKQRPLGIPTVRRRLDAVARGRNRSTSWDTPSASATRPRRGVRTSVRVRRGRRSPGSARRSMR